MREKRHAARRAARTAVTSRFVVLTGLSGSGKSQAIRALEDLGYFCVDNLPVTLLPMLAELTLRAGTEISRAAVVVDVREGKMLKEFPQVYRRLKSRKNLNPVLIFLEAAEPALVRRFSETRRPHPLAPDRSAIEGIREERDAMRAIRKLADHVIDTSEMTVHELRHVFTGVAAGSTPRIAARRHDPEFRVQTRHSGRLGLALRRALPAQSAFRPGAAALHRTRSGGRSVSGSIERNARVSRSHPEPAEVPDSAVRARGKDVFDDRHWLHRRTPPVGCHG